MGLFHADERECIAEVLDIIKYIERHTLLFVIDVSRKKDGGRKLESLNRGESQWKITFPVSILKMNSKKKMKADVV